MLDNLLVKRAQFQVREDCKVRHRHSFPVATARRTIDRPGCGNRDRIDVEPRCHPRIRITFPKDSSGDSESCSVEFAHEWRGCPTSTDYVDEFLTGGCPLTDWCHPN